MKLFLIIMLICSQVFAAFPPTTGSGQSDAAKTTTFNFVTPYNQATQIAGSTALIESGNNNLLLNPGFESITGITSWTAASGSVAADETTNIFVGKKSQLITMTAVNGLSLSQDITPTIQMSGSNFEASVAIKTAATTLQVCARQAAATYGPCATVQGDSQWHIYSVNMPGPTSGSIGVSVITTGATTGTYYVDAGYVGLARNLGNGIPNNVFSASVAATGVVTGQNQAFINGNCTYVTGTYTCNLVSNLFSVAPNLTVSAVNTGSNDLCDVGTVSTTSFTVRCYVANTAGSNSNSPFTVVVTRASTDWVQPTIQAPNWDIPNTSWTPTTTGFGTIASPTCFYSRVADRLLGDCRFTVGTPTAVTASITLPLGLTTNSAWGTQTCGNATTQSLAATAGVQVGSVYNVLCTGGTTTLNFGYRDSANGGLTALVASSGFTASQPISFQFSVPIQGWTTTLNAPLLVGSVTSNSTGALKMEAANLNNTNGSIAVNTSTSSWITATSCSAAGTCTYGLSGFSSAPYCTCSANAAAASQCTAFSITSSSLSILTASNIGTAANENNTKVICMGAR